MSKLDLRIKELIVSNRIAGLSTNDNDVGNGFLFAAIKGLKFNGEDFIGSAIKNGAKFILKSGNNENIYTENGITYVEHPNPRKYLSFICSMYYKELPKNISTVTGTNGKTSIVNFANQILWNLNIRSASLGTFGIIKNNTNPFESMTTPPPIELRKQLTALKKENIDNVFLESSSQGLDQFRTDYIDFKSACITNINSDHLDYHKTRSDYINAKMRLFTDIVHDNYIIHSSSLQFFSNKMLEGKKVYVYGYKNKNNFSSNIKYASIEFIIENANSKEPYMDIKITIDGKTFFTKTLIHVIFQLENLLAAILMTSFHIDGLEKIINTIPHINNIPGRCDFVKSVNGGKIFIDFAHNPDGLRTVLSSLSIYNKKIITIFGCGGERDTTKRPEMARIAEEFSSYVIVTDDNPRNEDSEIIRSEILKGFSKNFNNILEISDRKTAILAGMSMLTENSILLIAGKGVEEYQIIGSNKVPYSDYKSVNSYNACTKEFIIPKFLPKQHFKKNFLTNNISRINIGGKIKVLFVPESFEELESFLQTLTDNERVIVFGACSNILITPFYIDAIGIKLSKLSRISLQHKNNNGLIIAEGGAFCESLAKFAKLNNCEGFEFLNGIPGSIGGGIFMNAGCFGSDFAKILFQIDVLNLKTKTVEQIKDFSNFRYRTSNLDENYIILRGYFKTRRSNIEKITEIEKSIMAQKWKSQPKMMTCGSTFKNPVNNSAWKLIKESMPENFRIGGFSISNLHANFLINNGNGTFKDFIQLISIIKKNVLLKFGILLELEIKIVY